MSYYKELLAENGNTKAYAVVDNEGIENPWSYSVSFDYKLRSRNFYMASEDMPELNNKDYWFEPIYAYIHSDMSVSTTPFSCKWDSGVLGYVAVKRPSKGGEFKTRKSFMKHLEVMTTVLDSYIKGDCYALVIEKDGNQTEYLCGFIGDHKTSGILDEAANMVK